MAPSFLRRPAAETHTMTEEEVARIHRPPQPRIDDDTNPFTRMHDDLAREWATMRDDRDAATEDAERWRTESVWQASEIDRLKRELADLRERSSIEITNQTRRADAAVEENAARRGKFAIISKALLAVISEESDLPVQRRPTHPAHEPSAPPPRNQHDLVPPTRMNEPHHVKLADKFVPRERTYNDTPRDGDPVSEQEVSQASTILRRLQPMSM